MDKSVTGNRPARDNRFIAIGFILAAIFWFVEGVIHAFVLEIESFSSAVFRPDPNELWMRLFVALIMIGTGFYASSVVTRLRRSEENLKRERDRAEEYFDLAGVVFVVLDKAARVVDINKKGCEVLSLQRPEVIGKDWIESFIPADERTGVREVFDELMAGMANSAAYHENRVVSGKLGERQIAWHNISLSDENGYVSGTLSSGMDITEIRCAERLLRESEEKYRTMIEESNDIVCVLDATGAISFVNKRFEELTGLAIDDLQGKSAYSFILEEDLDKVRLVHERVLSGTAAGYEVRLKDSHGAVRFIAVNSAPIRKNNEVVGLVSFGRDVTGERAAVAELNERISELERFTKATYSRELRMKELSDEVERLKKEREELRRQVSG